ncbi:MAG: hypothetical protein IRZ14_12720 [Chloroflexi bacterium]|mgnify:CR=1 FL=1|nr:hypothetical protein [Chloroflexota bacterium]
MRRFVIAGILAASLLALAGPAHAQGVESPAAVPVPGAAAVTAFLSGQPSPSVEQVVPVNTGNGYSLLVMTPATSEQPSWVTTRPARSWFEQDNFYSFGSSAPPR